MTGAHYRNASATSEQLPPGVESRTSTTHVSEPSGFVLSRVLGIDELAIFFGCSTEKIKRQAQRGELPAFKFGKSWYVREQDLQAFIERAVETSADPRR